MPNKKNRMINSKTIKNMITTLKSEAQEDLIRIYYEWVEVGNSLAELTDLSSSCTLKKMIKYSINPDFVDMSTLSKREKKAIKLMEDLELIKTQMFVSGTFLDSNTDLEDSDKKEDTNE